MKLSEHVDKIRNHIEAAFDKYLARIGIGKNKQLEIEQLQPNLRNERLRFEVILENQIGETGSYEIAREKLIDELTFTLFNRIAAVKVMEAGALFPPVLTKQTEHGDRSFGHKAWLEMNPHMRTEELEGIREYLYFTFNELGDTLPLYSNTYPYALLPDAISLNEIIDAFNEVEKDAQVDNDIWESDDVLGWMYESYNNKKKKIHKDSGEKTEYNKVSLQSQVYTPQWVVKFLVENSIGKLYLEMYPNSEIRYRYKIANAPQSQERKPKPLHEVKVIDPACGSGNFLLYAFDFFYELYVDQIENYGADYDERDISKLIIENNLHGIDLDDRAVQLSQLGLFIKAKKKRRTIGELEFNVVSSDFFLPDYEEVEHIFNEGTTLNESQQELISDIWTDLQSAYKFGSLIRLDEKVKAQLKDLEAKQNKAQLDLFAVVEIEDYKSFATTFFTNLKTAVEQYALAKGVTFLTSKTRDAITFLELLTTEYDVAMANPPYTDSTDFGLELKSFIEANYKKPYKFHTNLYATFIKRCYDLTGEDGKFAMIHPNTFMFIKSFEDARKFMIDRCHIDVMIDFGLDRVNLFGPEILLDASFYIVSKKSDETSGVFFDLITGIQEKHKKEEFLKSLGHYIEGISNKRVFSLNQSKLKIIKSYPFIFWISDEFRSAFTTKEMSEIATMKPGLQTGNNFRFLRYWWEYESVFNYNEQKKWYRYAKGGPFNKWSGNLWTLVNWSENGTEIKNYVDEKGKLKSRPQNEAFYFKSGITYSALGGRKVSFRILPKGCIFDVGGASIFPNDSEQSFYILSLLNSTLSKYIIGCLNPTVNIQAGDIQRIPFIEPDPMIKFVLETLTQTNVKIKDELAKYSLFEISFRKSPYLGERDLRPFFNYENYLLSQVLINEALINEKIFEVYDLTEQDKAMVLAKEGESIGGLPVLTEALDAYLSETEVTKEFPLDAVRDFIMSLPTRQFTIEEREEIERGFPTLYQNNNNLEEFCIRHQVNPINVWYWFKQSNVIPQQRMHTLAMEFLADMIREILMEDEDGIIPLVPNAGEKVLLDRIEDKFREKGFSSAQYSSFDTLLGRPIHEYLNKFFFAELSDHLNLFMYLPKTPFIWHLSSGPEQGFDCYVIIYKWSRDKLLRLRSVIIEHRERSLMNRQSDLVDNNSAEAQNEKDRIFRKLKEIEAFKIKIDELLAEGYAPILDDGVGKNIAPLQKKGIIPYEVLNAGQLKKYLNADW